MECFTVRVKKQIIPILFLWVLLSNKKLILSQDLFRIRIARKKELKRELLLKSSRKSALGGNFIMESWFQTKIREKFNFRDGLWRMQLPKLRSQRNHLMIIYCNLDSVKNLGLTLNSIEIVKLECLDLL